MTTISLRNFFYASMLALWIAVAYVFGDNSSWALGMAAVTAVRPLKKPGPHHSAAVTKRKVTTGAGPAMAEQAQAVEQSFESRLQHYASSEMFQTISGAAEHAAKEGRTVVKCGEFFSTMERDSKLCLEVAKRYATERKISVDVDALFSSFKARTAWSRLLWPPTTHPHMHDTRTAASNTRGYMRIQMWISEYRIAKNSDSPEYAEKKAKREAKRAEREAKGLAQSVKVDTLLATIEGTPESIKEAESVAIQRFHSRLKDAKLRKLADEVIQFTLAAVQSRLKDQIQALCKSRKASNEANPLAS